MGSKPLITTYLEMRSSDQLRPKRADARFQVREKTDRDWRFNRDLYLRVGEQWTGSTSGRGRLINGSNTRWRRSCEPSQLTMATRLVGITNCIRTLKTESRSPISGCCPNLSGAG